MITITDKYSKDADAIIYNGSCYEFVKKIPSESVKLVVTSPPYNIGKEYEKRTDLDQYYKDQEKIIDECVRILSEDGSICWQVGNYVTNGEIVPLDVLLFPIFTKHNLKLRNRIVWHFGHGLHASKRFSGRYETILWFTKGDNYTFNLDAVRIPQKYPNKKYFKGNKRGELSCNPLGKNPSDIWEIPNVKSNHVEKTIHPCQFPIELIERLVLSMTNENDYVFDPFLGVGSTTAAAVKNKRKGIGSEIMKEYWEIAVERTEAAYNGTLKTRPMHKPVYDPADPKINLNYDKELHSQTQQTLFEKKRKYEVINENR
ncbi:adenine-specific DNA-methyltransferase [Alkalispirochaeta americana]|uniref:Methyltransferase n=1 Tax=Alkalispirochaeta americana TaxID=159291 RepID=A0A1N6Y854_9SPIO|nr:site-specific DNA-methyltransferase [Alkalispirochaeta americana]SIR10696.1 adenine-specific DNA-methyltransferase [Alkalispirochaeta americana]